MTIIEDLKAAFSDIAERAGTTFLQAFGAAIAVGGDSTAQSAAVAGVAAVLSMVKSVIATKVGTKGSPSLTA